MGEGEERKNLEDIIKKNGLENSVFLVGNMENASSYLKAFDIFTLTSITEALPYAILEAGKAEVPIIASNVGGIPEIITAGQTGVLIPPENAEATAEAISSLMANGLEREILGRNLETFVRNNFSLEQMVEKTVALYNEK